MKRIEEFKVVGMSEEEWENLAMDGMREGEIISWESTEYLDEQRSLCSNNPYYVLIHYISEN